MRSPVHQAVQHQGPRSNPFAPAPLRVPALQAKVQARRQQDEAHSKPGMHASGGASISEDQGPQNHKGNKEALRLNREMAGPKIIS